jgi:hypothetical protein
MTTDDKLRQHFQELRTVDTQRAPAFSRVARVPVRSFTLPWWHLAIGLSAMVALIVTLTLKRQPVADAQQWTALSNWRATTDELLTVSSAPWGSAISTPTDSLIQNSNQTNQKETL